MNATLVPSMVTSIFLIFIIGGFIFGWFRGLSKSLIRFFIILAVGVLTFFVVPPITKAVLELDISKMNIVLGNVHVMTVQDFVTDILRQFPVVEDIIESSPTIEAVIEVAPQILLNVVLFIVLFFVFKWISMLIYWTFAGIFFSKKKMEGKERHNFIGAVIGAIQGLIIVFVLLVPFYGVIETVRPMSVAVQQNVEQHQVATFDIDDDNQESVINVNAVADDISVYIKAFDNVWLNKVLNFVGIKKLGVNMFDKLTTVESDKVNLSLMGEIETISEAYPYVRPIVEDGFDLANNEQLKGIKSAIDELYESPILSNIVKEIVPEIASRWSNGYDFCGINKPTAEEAKTQALLDALFLNLSAAEGDAVKTDINTSIDIMMIANNAELIKTIKENGNILDVLNREENKNFLSSVIEKALESGTLKAILPKTIDAGMNIIYGMLGVDTSGIGSVNIDSNDVDWTAETPKLQTIFNNFIEIYLQIQEGVDSGKTALESLDFKTLGETFDNIRFSVILGPTSVDIMEALLNTTEIVGEDKETLAPFIQELKEAWEGDEPLAPTFEALGKALKLAKDLQNNKENFNVDELGDVLSTLAGNEALKDVVNEVVKTETLQDMGLSKETADVVEETISSVINGDYSAGAGNSLEKEIEAVKEVYDVANKVINADEGEKVEITTEQSQSLIGSLAESTIILDQISKNGSSVADLGIQDSLTEESKMNIMEQIEALDSEQLEGKTEQEIEDIKNKLASIFGF